MKMSYLYDELGDDDDLQETSREEYEMTLQNSRNGSSSSNFASKRRELQDKLAQHDAEISRREQEIEQLQALVRHYKEERNKVSQQLQAINRGSSVNRGRPQHSVDYTHGKFPWTDGLKAKMKSVFGINNFRLCQEGVCNANMDRRDIVCVMPTGGGKSLTYQLPALLQPGCTVVISPLISLITDQILHLLEAGVQAVKLTGTTSKEESKAITSRLIALANGDVVPGNEIKLCYVTPEKIAKSKTFLGLLERLADAGQLARFVIDEAHCVSQLGHDFRPDYSKLHVLRTLFLNVPILALSATCPPKVLDSLIKTLKLPKIEGENSASGSGTVYLTAPLYRKNLHYSIVPKPARSQDVLKAMTDYILQHHRDHSGIIYCLSKKDAENVAEGMRKHSNGIIKTGVYHAERGDQQKENLHIEWRRGTVKVVCATIAFGLGIDKGDVRFVLHHSLSKSLEGFYQESGRAGRDGKDSDCVLYYRPQDGTSISSMIAGEKEGVEKLHAMLKFVHNLNECRKTQFAKYFSHTTQVDISAWSTAESDALSPCGHCDNCTRPPNEVTRKDITYEAWQLVKIVKHVTDRGGTLTMNSLAALARGNAKGEFEAGSRKGKHKETLDLEDVAGGQVDMPKDDIECLIVDILLSKYLANKFTPTAYTTNIYIICGPLAPTLYRLTKEQLSDEVDRIYCVFRAKLAKPKAASKSKKALSAKAASKRKRGGSISDADDSQGEGIPFVDNDVDSEDNYPTSAAIPIPASSRPATAQPHGFVITEEETDEDEDYIDDWQVLSKRNPTPRTKRARTSPKTSGQHGEVIKEDETDVIILTDSD